MDARAVVATALLLASCTGRRNATFEVMAGSPVYRLRSPDKAGLPLPETLSAYSDLSQGRTDLKPGMALKLETAYFKPGEVRRGLANFLGTESVEIHVAPNGALRSTDLRLLPNRPPDQPPIDSYLRPPQQRKRFHRLLLQVVMNRGTGESNAILLSGKSQAELAMLTAKLTADPGSICGGGPNCAVFPVTGSVSVGMEVEVNGKPTFVAWGTLVGTLAGKQRPFSLTRLYRGRQRPVQLDINDPESLRLPLLPQQTWLQPH